MKNFLLHQTLLQSSQAAKAFSHEVGTIKVGRNIKILRNLEGMLRKECRATLNAIGTFGFRGHFHLSDASLRL